MSEMHNDQNHSHNHEHSPGHTRDHNHEHSAEELAAKKAARPQIERDTKYWLSLEHYNQDPEFLKKAEQEFISSPLSSEEGSEKDGWARREFLKLMGASVAMATAGCLRRPVQKIVPYNKQPEEVTLGVPNYYTSTFSDGSEVLGLLVKTKEGRPIKIEGNPSHPVSGGAIGVRAQASLLSLYDPERLKGPKKNLFNEEKRKGSITTGQAWYEVKDTLDVKWEELDDKVVAQLKKGSVALLTGSLSSPSTRSVVKEFSEAFKAQHVSWEPFSHEEIRQGQKSAYGDDLVPKYDFSKAQMIVSVDADFLGTWLQPAVFTKQFAAGRKNLEQMNRLVVFDSNYSLTGANADFRFKIKPSQQLWVVMGLAHEIVVAQGKSSFSGNANVKSVLSAFAGAAEKLKIEPALFKKVAADLWDNKGKSLVVAGGPLTLTAQAHELQVAVNFLNSVLENDGKTIQGKSGDVGLQSSYAELTALMKKMKDGQVKTLIIHRTNPAYGYGDIQAWSEALKKVEMVIYTGDRQDETGSMAHFLAPDNHAMETWGDAEPVAGVFTIQQPTIRPMYDTRSFQLTLMTWAYLAKLGPKRLLAYETFYDYLRNYWKEEIFAKAGKGQSFDDFWAAALEKGYVGEAKDSASRSFKAEALSGIKPMTQDGYELALYSTVQLGDGTLSNVSWLHELPDPVTKIVWDNYVSVSLATSEKLKLKEGTLVEVKVGSRSLTLPAHIQPGLHDDVLAIAVGYGRTHAGQVGNQIGQNAFTLMSHEQTKSVASGLKAEITSKGQVHELANTQGHNSMEGRQIVVEATLKDYQKKKDANIHKHHIWNIWSGHQYNGHKWGMSVDLNSCTGCSACMTACQSENNISVVGKKYILQGREMSWIRIDRYYTGTPDNPEAVFQPIMCQHCDNAPCETVCPVLATVHSNEGLNEMVYNRCVGTRYCSNNCPYKVRRFNWFNYAKMIEKPLHLALNPDVTVRVRGVMEKCTFCVQRIKDGKNKAKLEGRSLKDGDIKTACQTSCPTGAIVFGDMNDPNSQVSQMFKNERAYALLEEWHAAPSVRYLSKIRNNDKESKEHGTAKQGEHS